MEATKETRENLAIAPGSFAAATTTYNGAVVASAVGIDVRAQGRAELVLMIGAASDSSAGIAVTVESSTEATNPAGKLTAVTGAAMTVVGTDDNTLKSGYMKIGGLPAGHRYLYVKVVQTDTEAVLLGATIVTSMGLTKPNGNTPVFDV